jgi:ribosomal protein S18 acetylase RimI-like enzyme
MMDICGNEVFREALIGDLEGLAVLFNEYRIFYRQPPDRMNAKKFLAARFEAKDSKIFVAQANTTLAGFIQLYPSFSSVSMKRLWILNDLYVNPKHRRRGIGFGLLDIACKFAQADGAKGLVLSTENNNEPAQALYKKFGFKPEVQFREYHVYF